MVKYYELPVLPYSYDALEPHMSEQVLKLHHDKHHLAYVNGANDILKKIEQARGERAEIDMKAALKALSFNVAGHVLHTLFWENMTPSGQKPHETIAGALEKEFGSFERFKKEFTQAAVSVEGSGWAALSYCRQTGRPIIMQIEKHNVNIYPMFKILLALDVWEHAYYLDYKSNRAEFVEAFWSIVNWDKVNERLEALSIQT